MAVRERAVGALDPFGVWRGAARLGARATVAALDAALASRRTGAALDHLLAGPLADAATRALVRGEVLERVTAELLATDVLDHVVAQVVESPATERLVAQVVGSRLVDESIAQLLASREFWHVVDEVARSPAVTDAISVQGFGFADQVAGEVRASSRRADAWLERLARRTLHREAPPQPSLP
jgi:hypothetical protein